MIFCDPKAKPVLTARNVNKESGILSGFQGIVSHDQFGMAALSAGGMYAPNICHPWFKAFESLKKKKCKFYLWGYIFSDSWLSMLRRELIYLESRTLVGAEDR